MVEINEDWIESDRIVANIIKDVIALPGLILDCRNSTMVANDAIIQLSSVEAEILKYLLLCYPETVTRESIVESVWQYKWTQDTRFIDPYMGTLRKKLSSNLIWNIETIRGIGFRLSRTRAW